VRVPANAIRLGLDSVLLDEEAERALPQETRETLEMASASTLAMTDVLNSVLSLSAMEARSFRLNRSPGAPVAAVGALCRRSAGGGAGPGAAGALPAGRRAYQPGRLQSRL
jgi:signal transduction histidine kinase